MQDGHFLRIRILGDSNVGLFCAATETFCLAPRTVTDKQALSMEKTLGVPVYKASIAGANFIGAFAAANKNGVVVSSAIEDGEKKLLEKDLGVNVCVLDSRFNAFGNLVASNDSGAIISPLFTESQKKSISECLGVEACKTTIAKTPLPGSGCLASNKGALLHRDVTDGERGVIESVLKVKSLAGTLNFGSPWVGAVGVCNRNGFVTGHQTTVHEIVRADEALGFV
ncbi:MAG: translation initiation factor IF-6 [Candidatus Aenigmarchaeota archaeon]|nr:translation initiation factor IF-6 [Candidatus Aenigmarchaeota archaeon]